jgi:hypothetical protein
MVPHSPLYQTETLGLRGAAEELRDLLEHRIDIALLEYLTTSIGDLFEYGTAYHSQTDGQSERTIQTMEDMLRACVIDFGGS